MKEEPPFDESSFLPVIKYYDETRFDYNIAWLSPDNPSIHFGFYDQHADKHADALANTNRVLADRAGIGPGQRVLDAGCGIGGSCLWLARHRKVHAIGITPVKSQVVRARQIADTAGLSDRVSFYQADYCAAPFEDESFDCIWACESLCHAGRKQDFYREAYRLLRPGGQLVIAEYVRRSRPLAEEQEQLLLGWLHRWAIPDIGTIGEHQQYAGAANLINFEWEDATRYTWVSLKNLHKIARRWLWADYLLYWTGIRSKAQHNNILGGLYQFQALQQNLWFYAILRAEKPLQ